MEIKVNSLHSARVLAEVSSPYRLDGVSRAVALIELLGQSNIPLSLSEISDRMQVPKSTVHRALIVLQQSAFIERTKNKRFRLGMRLYQLGNRAVEQFDLTRRAHPFLQRLSIQVGETVHLSVLQGTSVVYLDRLEPTRRVCKTVKAGSSNPVYCTAMGKALLAFQPEAVAEQIISDINFARFTDKTITSKEELLKAIRAVRRRGYAIDDEELEVSVRCVGAPVFDERDCAIGAISASGPIARVTLQRVPAIAARVQRCCRDVAAVFCEQQKN